MTTPPSVRRPRGPALSPAGACDPGAGATGEEGGHGCAHGARPQWHRCHDLELRSHGARPPQSQQPGWESWWPQTSLSAGGELPAACRCLLRRLRPVKRFPRARGGPSAGVLLVPGRRLSHPPPQGVGALSPSPTAPPSLVGFRWKRIPAEQPRCPATCSRPGCTPGSPGRFHRPGCWALLGHTCDIDETGLGGRHQRFTKTLGVPSVGLGSGTRALSAGLCGSVRLTVSTWGSLASGSQTPEYGHLASKGAGGSAAAQPAVEAWGWLLSRGATGGLRGGRASPLSHGSRAPRSEWGRGTTCPQVRSLCRVPG